jgi:titin
MNTKYSKQLLFRFLSVCTILLLALSPFSGALAQAAATYVVNTAGDADDGACSKAHCSLREAIHAANAHPGADMITFKIRGPATFTIQPTSALPVITDPVTIDGTTQRGYAGHPIVELDGSNASDGEPDMEIRGLVISAGGSTVRGLVINRFSGDGIVLTTNGGNRIEGNFIGTDRTGTTALGNFRGVVVQGGSSNNLIGGTEIHTGNLISGNGGAGVRLSDQGTEDNKVQGNFLGTDLTGMNPLGNNLGVRIVDGAANNLIGGTENGARNIISGNYDTGIYIDVEEVEGTTGNIVQGNYIGTDASGAAALPNGNGVVIAAGATNTLIGGVEAGAGNVISGNSYDGMFFVDPGTTGNILQGNFIGTDASGATALPNGADGVRILGGASNTLIGGTEDGAPNLISGNTYIGVSIWDTGTSGNIIQGNYIGTDLTGTQLLGNSAEGVSLFTGASDNLISGNLISGNGSAGVKIADPGTTGNKVQGNLIGTDATGTQPLGNLPGGITIMGGAAGNLVGGTEPGIGNTIAFNGGPGIALSDDGGSGNSLLSNLLYSNEGLGIDLGDDGVSPNDPLDADSGPNDLQNYPVITGVTPMGKAMLIHGSLDSTPSTTFRLEFFSNDACAPSGYGEGQVFLGFNLVTTNPVGFARFKAPVSLPEGAFVTATATDPNGSTSELSNCIGP